MKPTLEAALKYPITRGRSDSDTRSDSRALQMDSECLNSPETENNQFTVRLRNWWNFKIKVVVILDHDYSFATCGKRLNKYAHGRSSPFNSLTFTVYYNPKLCFPKLNKYFCCLNLTKQ